jgi:hypothetical protein
VEEKDMNLEPDEEKDVEGHVQYGVNQEVQLGREDEGEDDDVEGHVNYGVNQEVQLGREDEGDDVEGHVNY